LAKLTGNATYSDWATKSYQWSNGSGLVENYNVFQGTSVRDCEEIDHSQWTDNAGTYIIGAAYMYNVTDGSSIWKSTLDGLLNKTLTTFFPDGIAKELCEATGCPDSQHIAKGILIRNLVDTMSITPYTSSVILPVVRTTAVAAAKACDENRCAFEWNWKETNSSNDLENDLSALQAVQALLSEQNFQAKAGSGDVSGGIAKPSGNVGNNLRTGLMSVIFGTMITVLL
ncbi:hypothetical protein HYALB_00010554, partial [Hymenoscyphus albidus]